jgi:hypothetical protein
MTAKRIYLVSGGERPRMVNASSQAQAIGHVVRKAYQATVATQRQIVDFMMDNDLAEVEEAAQE